MAFFEKKEKICVNCGEKVKTFGSTEISEGWLCSDCCKKCGYDTKLFTKKKTITDVKNDMEVILAKKAELQTLKAEVDKKEAVRKELLDNFNATKVVSNYITIDEDKKQWMVGKIKKHSKIYNFNDIVSFELIDLGSAKECSMLRIKIIISNFETSSVDIKFFESGIATPTFKRDSFVYRTNYKLALECMSLLQLISESNRGSVKNNVSQMSDADEILKFKNLLDNGIITQDEFYAKKKKLLGL
jgi:septum formation topological specificity factor MinE